MKKIAALTNIPKNDDLKITDRAHALMQKVHLQIGQDDSWTKADAPFPRSSGLTRSITASLLML
jgi:hypothetical protein